MHPSRIIKEKVLPVVLAPPHVQYCNQTVYQALLGCCRMWEAAGNDLWRRRADRLAEILLRIQRPDGGFDIGYRFNFTYWHEKGQSTSPELVGLLALVEYAKRGGDVPVQDGIRRAVAWIRRHATPVGSDAFAVPYSPHTTKEIVVHNGTSFATGALGHYLGWSRDDDPELHRIYRGMIRYLSNVMDRTDTRPGRFWYYCDQNMNLNAWRRGLVDYYHQMQQVEMHAIAQQSSPCAEQRALIADAADYVFDLWRTLPIVPYYNRGGGKEIHLWGLTSVASGFLEAAAAIPEKATPYLEAARSVTDWIVTHAWNGTSFDDVLRPDGSRVAGRRYMVRSDAWVFNSLAGMRKGDPSYRRLDTLLEVCCAKMEQADWSGPETHASTFRTRSIGRIVSLLLRLRSPCPAAVTSSLP